MAKTHGTWSVGPWRLSVDWRGPFALCSYRRGAAAPESFVLRHTGDRRDLVRHLRRVLAPAVACVIPAFARQRATQIIGRIHPCRCSNRKCVPA